MAQPNESKMRKQLSTMLLCVAYVAALAYLSHFLV